MEQKTIKIEHMITVGDLAAKLDIPVTTLIGELFKNGVMATVNQRIDFDTAEIMVEELDLGFKLELEAEAETEATEVETDPGEDRKNALTADTRPPVVAEPSRLKAG